MIKVAFFILRLIIALGAVAALAATLAVFFAENLIELIKGGAKMVVAVVTIFASGFQKSPEAPGPSVVVSPILAGLAITFLGMFASVFMPGQKIFLHIVAALSVGAAAYDIWRSTTVPGHQFLFMPLIVLWFVYYVVCLRRG
ncbi:MAG TPA: hypothetical protein VK752_19425 [Bryobacteraceae bacterium]|nr:hypothetical protein [Bryobacteraceae bacterium]